MHLDAAAFSQILTRRARRRRISPTRFTSGGCRATFRLQDGKIHEAGVSVVCGVGIRVISGERAGYAYTDDLSLETLLETARVASG